MWIWGRADRTLLQYRLLAEHEQRARLTGSSIASNRQRLCEAHVGGIVSPVFSVPALNNCLSKVTAGV